jgi:hypothetical protein
MFEMYHFVKIANLKKNKTFYWIYQIIWCSFNAYLNFLFPEIWICKLPLFLCVSLYFRNCSEPLIPIHVFVVLDTFSKENIYFRTYIVKGEIILLFHLIKCLVDIQTHTKKGGVYKFKFLETRSLCCKESLMYPSLDLFVVHLPRARTSLSGTLFAAAADTPPLLSFTMWQ